MRKTRRAIEKLSDTEKKRIGVNPYDEKKIERNREFIERVIKKYDNKNTKRDDSRKPSRD